MGLRAKARPAAARRVSVGLGARVEGNAAPVAPAKGNVARVDRPLVDRRRVGLAGDGAQGWGRQVRSDLWSAPCHLTPTATGSSTAMN